MALLNAGKFGWHPGARYLQENYGIPAFRLNFWQQVKSICMEITLGIKEGTAGTAAFAPGVAERAALLLWFVLELAKNDVLLRNE